MISPGQLAIFGITMILSAFVVGAKVMNDLPSIDIKLASIMPLLFWGGLNIILMASLMKIFNNVMMIIT